MKKYLLILVLCATASVHAAALEISSGQFVLSKGTYTYDYVSITGGSLKLVGDVNIICNGKGTAYFSFTAGTIYNDVAVDVCDCNNGVNGANGNAGANDGTGQYGQSGSNGADYFAAAGKNGCNLSIYANRDITITSIIDLRGSDGVNHNGYAGFGGLGGRGGNAIGGIGGAGGRGGNGGTSWGGNGGNGGKLHLETHGGNINFGNSPHAYIYTNGGNGGNGGHGGGGGRGGDGGPVIIGSGTGGGGGPGGNGGHSIAGQGGNAGAVYCKALDIIDTSLFKEMLYGLGGTHMNPPGWNYGTRGIGGYGGSEPYGNKGADGPPGLEGNEYFNVNGQPAYYSKHYITEPNSCASVQSNKFGLIGDINKDCSVNLKDFAEFALQWTTYCYNPQDDDCDKPWRHIY